jgi:hypothetical protein
MKTKLSTKQTSRGMTLLVALFLCTILSITIAGYLRHAFLQNRLSMRSQTWNLSMAVSEAGVEEAMEQLNLNTGNLAANGWSQSGNLYTITRVLDANTSYTVSIDNSDQSSPLITCVSDLHPPSLSATLPALGFLAAIGVNTPPTDSTRIRRAIQVKTGRSALFLKAMVAKHTIDFNGNYVMTDSFDSSNPNYSNNGLYPSGQTSKLLNNGDVASNDSIVNIINVGNANIYGHVATGPGGSIYVGPGGGVGDHSWQAANSGIESGYFSDNMNFTFPSVSLPYTSGLTPSTDLIYSTNYSVGSASNTVTSSTYPSPVPATGVITNISYTTASTVPSPVPYGTTTNTLTQYTTDNSFPKAGTYVGTVTKVPNTSMWAYYVITGTNYTYPSYTYTYLTLSATTNYTVTSTGYDYVLQGGDPSLPPVDYYLSSLPGGNVLVKGNARLVIAGNLDVGGNNAQNQITLTSDAKLQMWVGGTSCKISGNGVVNPTGYAQNFICWCTDSVTSLSLNGNGQFTGIVVAPNANVTLNGGGNSNQDFIGALLANTVKLNGHFNFHYDEALRNLNGNGRFKVTLWNEIPVPVASN